MISAKEKISNTVYINRMKQEYLVFMGIDTLPDINCKLFEIDGKKVNAQGIGSTATVYYDYEKKQYILRMWKDLYMPVLHADYLVFHELTHAYDIERLAKDDRTKHAQIKGYIEYHAAQVELMKQLGANGFSEHISFSMAEMLKSIGNDKTVFEMLMVNKKAATDMINKPGFPLDIEQLATVMGMIFNHLGRLSICKRYANDYNQYKDQLEEFSTEEKFFGSVYWKMITNIYHDEMSQDAIDVAMSIHNDILTTVTRKYDLL